MRDLKIPIAIVVFVVVVLLGVGARYVYYESQVLDPMTQVAAEVPGVEQIRVAQGPAGRKDVHVTFGPDALLEEAYPRVEELARSAFGASFGRIIPEDRRTPELAEAYYRVHFLVQEGISTGHFAEMARAIDRQLAGAGVARHRVFVGNRYVFVQLHDGDRYLYEVVPRANPGAEPAEVA